MLPHDVESKLSLEDRDPLGCLADGPVQEQLLKAGSQEYLSVQPIHGPPDDVASHPPGDG